MRHVRPSAMPPRCCSSHSTAAAQRATNDATSSPAARHRAALSAGLLWSLAAHGAPRQADAPVLHWHAAIAGRQCRWGSPSGRQHATNLMAYGMLASCYVGAMGGHTATDPARNPRSNLSHAQWASHNFAEGADRQLQKNGVMKSNGRTPSVK